jgi:SAM-dependent methyltransferase
MDQTGKSLMNRRPVWRRLASAARQVFYRAATLIDPLVHSSRHGLLPPAHLRIYYYRTWSPDAFVRAGEGVRLELTSRGLRPEHRLLDVGSGIGNLALALAGYLRGGYDGIEIHPEAVTWCQQNITERFPDFRFHRADVASRAYNPHGSVPASAYCFPFADNAFDFVLLASVFTHMLPDDVSHYVQEISRVLAPGGVCVSSYFLLNDQTRASVEHGRSFMSFDVAHSSGVCRLHDPSIPEAAVAYEEEFVRRIHQENGLRIRDVRRGQWWSGEKDDQDILTVDAGP